MKTHIKVCTKSDWSTYVEVEDFDILHTAMVDKKVVEVRNLFGTRELIDGGEIITLHISTEEGRAKYEKFEKMINDETEEENPSWE
jgi:hypothetical protein